MADSSQYGRDDFRRGGPDEQLDADSLVEESDPCRSEIGWQKDGISFFDSSIRHPRAYRDGFADATGQMAEDVYDNQTNYDETVE